MNFSASLPPLDSSLRELLVRLGESLGLSDLTLAELGWAAFHRQWDAPMLEAWARAKKSFGESARVPKGRGRDPELIDPTNPWAIVELGTCHGLLPGQPETNECGTVVRAWLDNRPVLPAVFRKVTETLVREQAALYPNGKLANELRALDRSRRRARLTGALIARVQDRRIVPTQRQHYRRAPRRAAMRRVRVRSGDPPE